MSPIKPQLAAELAERIALIDRAIVWLAANRSTRGRARLDRERTIYYRALVQARNRLTRESRSAHAEIVDSEVKRGPGRPPKGVPLRTQQIKAGATEPEKTAVAAFAEHVGSSESDLIRDRIITPALQWYRRRMARIARKAAR